MLVRVLLLASFLVICATPAVVAQDAAAVVAAASKAMGTDNVNAIAYIGRARTGAFGQSKSIGDPMGPSTSRPSPITDASSTSPSRTP